MGQCGCVVGALTLPVHRGTTNTCCSRCCLSSAGESLVSHTDMLTFPFLCFPLLFPFPERDGFTLSCVRSLASPGPRCPTAVSLPWQHALHSCSARGKRRTLLSTPGPLSTEVPLCGEAFRLEKVPSSFELTVLLCPGGEMQLYHLGARHREGQAGL